ncbi:ABC-2 type transport system permease protein [Rhodoblastus acidophilus]|uniref:ABC transporter permease n=1 Tax=Rhodoblastus acidophilus TaxID=1074 RepID=UPI00222491B5|nr:ABC transporter permease [Rhodoblastus acidophilus]MCW2284409.1 ABC-2 type transport system permease protein [Rhodoblastus acidophilus]MCW2333256.1 ABC-2 type transport system permease protein [Rhodoblastus acidophilus]
MLSSLWRIAKLSGKEFRSLLADPVLVAIIVYVFTVAVVQVATGLKFEVESAQVAVVDEDHSDLSRRIVASLLPPLFKTADVIAPSQIDPGMDSGRYVFVVEIPPKFEAEALAGKTPSIQINVDATAMALAGNGAVYIQQIINRETAAFLTRSDQTGVAPVDLVVRSKFNPNLNSMWFTAVMEVINNVAILSIILTGSALIREREHGTIEHLLVMPVTPVEIMLAKIVANGAVIVGASLASLLLVVHWGLGIPIAGSVTLFVAGSILFMISVTALGLLLATFARTMPQFGLLSLPVIIILYLLSGSTTPLETMPDWLQFVMKFTPNTHFVAFAQAVLYRGAGIEQVWPQMLVMAVLGVATLALCRKRFAATISAQD